MDRECLCIGHTLTENTASAVSRCNSGPYLPLYIATAVSGASQTRRRCESGLRL